MRFASFRSAPADVVLWAALAAVMAAWSAPAAAQPGATSQGATSQGATSQGVEIAVSLPLTGDGATSFGQGTLEGIQFAIEEANASGAAPRIALTIHDDKGEDDEARAVARRIAASQAVLVLGPSFSTSSLAAGPTYAEAGIASLCPTATSDYITRSATTFRMIFKNSEQGEALAFYLARVLGARRAAAVVVDNGYGRSLRDGFERAAATLGIDAQYFAFTTEVETEEIARRIAADASQPPVVFLTLDGDASRMLTTLRRNGARGPVLGGDALGDESFSELLADLPEERRQRGAFTDGIYGISPMILDSANAEILAFAVRFRARFGHDPVWMAVAGYDAARAGIAAVRAAVAGGNADLRARRRAALEHLSSLSSPAQAIPGLLGPLWFDDTRGGQRAIRIGRFNRGRFESAPLQIVPVTTPDATERASGAVFEIGPGRFARLQRVVYTGVFVNEITRVDLSRASFGADFYLWLRFARDAGPDSPDPTDVIFPNLISGAFDPAHPAEQREMADGTVYRLWRVQGEFRNDFDLHRFPFDRQVLSLPFFNARAAVDRIVYVLDRRSLAAERSDPSPPAAGPGRAAAATPGASARAAEAPRSDNRGADSLAIASLAAFRNLTQWEPVGARQRRENLVTDSALGDPGRAGVESYRELSGFIAIVELQRRALATLAKTLLPLGLMTLIMFAALYFPHALVKEKITVAITGALSGAVLVTAINSQLGSVGYTIAVEYAFYVFFGLSLLSVVAVLAAERLRVAGRSVSAVAIERGTRVVFVLAVVATLAGAIAVYASG